MATYFSPEFVEFISETIYKEKAFMTYFETETRKMWRSFGNKNFSIDIPKQYRTFTCLNTLRVNLEKLGLKYTENDFVSKNNFAFAYINVNVQQPFQKFMQYSDLDDFDDYDNFTHIYLFV